MLRPLFVSDSVSTVLCVYKEWAERENIHPQTAYNWVREGTMPVPFRRTGKGGRTILVAVPTPTQPAAAVQVGLYALVSSSSAVCVQETGFSSPRAFSNLISVPNVPANAAAGLVSSRRV